MSLKGRALTANHKEDKYQKRTLEVGDIAEVQSLCYKNTRRAGCWQLPVTN